jgi:hypothetical protein
MLVHVLIHLHLAADTSCKSQRRLQLYKRVQSGEFRVRKSAPGNSRPIDGPYYGHTSLLTAVLFCRLVLKDALLSLSRIIRTAKAIVCVIFVVVCICRLRNVKLTALCTVTQGEKAIEKVFKACYADSAPFKPGYDTAE